MKIYMYNDTDGCMFVLTDTEGNYVYEIRTNLVVVTPELCLAVPFWGMDDAWSMAYNLHCLTGEWFGVKEVENV